MLKTSVQNEQTYQNSLSFDKTTSTFQSRVQCLEVNGLCEYYYQNSLKVENNNDESIDLLWVRK